MDQLMHEFRDFGLFMQTIFLVMLYTGGVVVLAVLLIRTAFQAYLYRNVADRSRQ